MSEWTETRCGRTFEDREDALCHQDRCDDCERARLLAGGSLTALILRDVASHLAAGEIMSISGAWHPQEFFIDHARPDRKWARKWYEHGRRSALADMAAGLRWLADANQEPQ